MHYYHTYCIVTNELIRLVMELLDPGRLIIPEPLDLEEGASLPSYRMMQSVTLETLNLPSEFESQLDHHETNGSARFRYY